MRMTGETVIARPVQNCQTGQFGGCPRATGPERQAVASAGLVFRCSPSIRPEYIGDQPSLVGRWSADPSWSGERQTFASAPGQAAALAPQDGPLFCPRFP